MSKTVPIPVYLMPGMAASPRIFEFIELPNSFVMHKLSWIPPQKGEALAAYAKRMSERIEKDHPILLGVSFGGILMQEIAKHIACRGVIIVSSVKSRLELPLSMRLAKRTGFHKLLPTQWIESLESLALFVFGPSIEERVKSYQKYLSERDSFYLDWSMHQIVHWKQTQPSDEVVHIHGTQDAVFPLKNLDTSHNFYQIKGATHAMILTHHRWFNSRLPEIIQQHF